MDIFSQIINIIGSCPSCESKNILFIINPVKKKGLNSCLSSVVKIVQNGLRKSKKELKNNSKGEKSSFDKNV